MTLEFRQFSNDLININVVIEMNLYSILLRQETSLCFCLVHSVQQINTDMLCGPLQAD